MSDMDEFATTVADFAEELTNIAIKTSDRLVDLELAVIAQAVLIVILLWRVFLA